MINKPYLEPNSIFEFMINTVIKQWQTAQA